MVFTKDSFCDSDSSGLVVRASASWVGGREFDPRPRQTKVFKTGSSGFPAWRSEL